MKWHFSKIHVKDEITQAGEGSGPLAVKLNTCGEKKKGDWQ